MATWATLEADAAMLRTGNDDILNETDYPDADLQDLNIDYAKEEIKIDMCNKWEIKYSDFDDYIEDILEEWETHIKKALAAKQLWIFYKKENNGEGSKTFYRMIDYEREYNDYKNQFNNMRKSDYGLSSVKLKIWG